MQFHPQLDTQLHLGEEVDHPLTPEGRWHVILGVCAILALVVSLYGLARLVMGGDIVGSLTYYGHIALAFVPVMLFALILVYETKLGERLAVSAIFQHRIDQMEARLRYRDALLRLIADHQKGAVAIFDRHNRFFFVNEPAAKHFKRPAEEMIDRPPIKILPNDQAKTLELRLAEVRATQDPISVIEQVDDGKNGIRFLQRQYEAVKDMPDMNGCVLLREDDLTSLIVEREKRERTLRQVIDTLVAVVDRRDPYASGHSLRVGQLARAIAQEMGLESQLVDAAEIAGSLMNFGKVLVSRRILTKTSPLTSEELQRVRDSILTSADILEIIGFDGPVVPTLRQVLERVDGSGSPDGLKGDEILVTARIVAAANAYVAFVSPRAHRDGLPFDKALAAINGDAGKAFDPAVIDALDRFINNPSSKLGWLTVTKPAIG